VTPTVPTCGGDPGGGGCDGDGDGAEGDEVGVAVVGDALGDALGDTVVGDADGASVGDGVDGGSVGGGDGGPVGGGDGGSDGGGGSGGGEGGGGGGAGGEEGGGGGGGGGASSCVSTVMVWLFSCSCDAIELATLAWPALPDKLSSTADAAVSATRSTSTVALSSVVCVESTVAFDAAAATAATAASTGSLVLLVSYVRLTAYVTLVPSRRRRNEPKPTSLTKQKKVPSHTRVSILSLTAPVSALSPSVKVAITDSSSVTFTLVSPRSARGTRSVTAALTAAPNVVGVTSASASAVVRLTFTSILKLFGA
jgi:hypothetical protein